MQFLGLEFLQQSSKSQIDLCAVELLMRSVWLYFPLTTTPPNMPKWTTSEHCRHLREQPNTFHRWNQFGMWFETLHCRQKPSEHQNLDFFARKTSKFSTGTDFFGDFERSQLFLELEMVEAVLVLRRNASEEHLIEVWRSNSQNWSPQLEHKIFLISISEKAENVGFFENQTSSHQIILVSRRKSPEKVPNQPRRAFEAFCECVEAAQNLRLGVVVIMYVCVYV